MKTGTGQSYWSYEKLARRWSDDIGRWVWLYTTRGCLWLATNRDDSMAHVSLKEESFDSYLISYSRCQWTVLFITGMICFEHTAEVVPLLACYMSSAIVNCACSLTSSWSCTMSMDRAHCLCISSALFLNIIFVKELKISHQFDWIESFLFRW